MTALIRNLVFAATIFTSYGLAQDRDTTRRPYDDIKSNRSALTNELTPEHFVQMAAWSGLKEVRLGELAQQRAQMSEVKEFGRNMVRDHSAANRKLTALAQRKGFTLPPTNSLDGTNDGRTFVREGLDRDSRTDTQRQQDRSTDPSRTDRRDQTTRAEREPWSQDIAAKKQKDLQTVKRLEGLSGNEFDRAYITEMVHAHEKAVQMFQHASMSLRDSDLKSFAAETLPKLEEHHRMAQKLAKDNNWPTDKTPDRNPERRER